MLFLPQSICSTPTRCINGRSPPGDGPLTEPVTVDGLGACSIKAQLGEVLVDAASSEQLAAPGLGRLPVLPLSNSKPAGVKAGVVSSLSEVDEPVDDLGRLAGALNRRSMYSPPLPAKFSPGLIKP